MLIIQTDAAFDPQTQVASIAFVIKDFSTKKIIIEAGEIITATDNHVAEFTALTYALNYLIEHGQTDGLLEILTDSKALFLAVEKNYSKSYPNELAKIMMQLREFNLYYTKLISDKENKHAHQIAINKLHKKTKN